MKNTKLIFNYSDGVKDSYTFNVTAENVDEVCKELVHLFQKKQALTKTSLWKKVKNKSTVINSKGFSLDIEYNGKLVSSLWEGVKLGSIKNFSFEELQELFEVLHDVVEKPEISGLFEYSNN